MKLNMRFLSLLFLFNSCFVFAENAAEGYFPKNNIIEGEVMQIAAPKELQILRTKLGEAVKNNPEWFAEHAKSHGSTQGNLPYHENFGLTKIEYDDFLKLVNEKLSLQSIGSTKIVIEKTEDGNGYIFKANSEEFPLNGVKLYPQQGYIETNYARLSTYSEINQSNPDSPTGAWKGIQWKHEEIKDGSAISVKLAIGKRTKDGKGIIYYDVKYLVAKNPQQFHLVVLY